jgi:holo-[acyl-carrier protein] synthase
MILGVGTDLANIERIEAVLLRHGDRFKDRVFTKALGTGLRMGIGWKDMAVTNLRSGQPVMHVTGWAAERLQAMTPAGHEAVIHVTLTDDHPWAQAFVVIEARPLALGGAARA